MSAVDRFGRGLAGAAAIGILSCSLGARNADAQVTALYFDSQPGDYIGGGASATWTPADAYFTVSSASSSLVRIYLNSPTDFGLWWYLDFEAPDGQALAPGLYTFAERRPFRTEVSPGLDVYGSGRGCNTLTGRFEILEIELSATGVLQRFAVDFEQYCESGSAALFGALRYNSTHASLDPFDGDYPVYALEVRSFEGGQVTGTGIDCGGTGTDCAERFPAATTVDLLATAHPGYEFVGWAGTCQGISTAFTITVNRTHRCLAVFQPAPGSSSPPDAAHAGGILIYDQVGDSSAAGRRIWPDAISAFRMNGYSTSVRIEAQSGELPYSPYFEFVVPSGLAAGTYDEAYSSYSETFPRLYAGCSGPGRFVVHEIEVASGEVVRLAIDFESRCTYGFPVRGVIRYRSTRAAIRPFDGAFTHYALTVAPSAYGTVTAPGIDCGAGAVDCTETYAAGTTVALAAAARPGYVFAGWNGHCAGTTPASVTLTLPQRCAAVFNPLPRTGFPNDATLAYNSFVAHGRGGTLFNGRRQVWTSDAAIVLWRSGDQFVTVGIEAPNGERWYVDFGAPSGQALGVGAYTGTSTVYSSASPVPLLYVGAPPGVGSCWSATGRFLIHELRVSSNTVTAFAADFELACGGASPGFFGAIRYRSSHPTILPFGLLTRSPGAPGVDFNADDHLDLSWHHQIDGRLAAWVMDGLSLAYGSLLSPAAVPDPSWKVVGAGDIDGDGHTDLVWQNTRDGRISAWLLDRLTLRRGELLSIPQVLDTNWRVRSVADFNRDGRADLLWQHRDGRISVWLLDGPTVIGAIGLDVLQVSDPDWIIVGTADFDGDGSPDFVWHHRTLGLVAVWLMDGFRMIDGSLTSPDRVLGWEIRAVGDVNADGCPDLVWQNPADGRLAVWLMNGLLMQQGLPLSPPVVADPGWHIVGPR